MGKITVAKLIADAEKIKKNREKCVELYIPSLEENIVVQKPSKELILEAYNMEEESEGNLFLVYESIVEPNLKAKELQETYGTIGYEILDKIFEPGEIDAIAKEVLKFAGYTDGVKVVETVKN